jgi:hypothetical protein
VVGVRAVQVRGPVAAAQQRPKLKHAGRQHELLPDIGRGRADLGSLGVEAPVTMQRAMR